MCHVLVRQHGSFVTGNVLLWRKKSREVSPLLLQSMRQQCPGLVLNVKHVHCVQVISIVSPDGKEGAVIFHGQLFELRENISVDP